MAAAFAEIALPWLQPQPLGAPGSQGLGPGLGAAELQAGLERLVAWEDVRAVVVFGSRARGDAQADSDLDLAVICAQPQLTPQQKQACYQRFRAALGGLGCGVDLVVQGQADAAYLAQSRWHVMGDVAREGKVLYVAG